MVLENIEWGIEVIRLVLDVFKIIVEYIELGIEVFWIMIELLLIKVLSKECKTF